MRIFIAGFGCEVNSFVTARATLDDFALHCLYREGAEPRMATPTNGHSDMAALAQAGGHQVLGGTIAFAPPTGPLELACWQALRARILDDLRAAGPVDIILMNLHGATLADDGTHCEAVLMDDIRHLAGPGVVVGALLDLHCHLSPGLLQSCDLLVAYKHYPHTDVAARAGELYRLALATALGQVRPVMEMVAVPVIGAFPTVRPAMAGFVDWMVEMEGRDGILSVSLIHGFPWGDHEQAGARALAIADGDPAQAQAAAEEIATRFWRQREELALRPIPLDHALAIVATAPPGPPFVLADGSDNPGGGAPGDATHILRGLIDAGVQGAAVGLLHDSETVETAWAAGIGGTFQARIGGRREACSGEPVTGTATVLALRDDGVQRHCAVETPPLPIGGAAAIRIGGVDVVVTEGRSQTFSPDVYTELGIDPLSKRILVPKSTVHFFSNFVSITDRILYVDTPGGIDLGFRDIRFQHLKRPVWPLDPL
ncbi:M81 family metallopeptidase [Niveispirillum sp. KHB5.9]|uniref:M81 family metallopeptidase n=1 Tax=Niveispirillum sp. KHB5.9 TaxID=3400269 RepID=UPI003A89DA60